MGSKNKKATQNVAFKSRALLEKILFINHSKYINQNLKATTIFFVKHKNKYTLIF